MNRELKLAYVAGLFDGEGSFSIQVMNRNDKANFSPKMSMTLKYGTEALDRLVDLFGGSIYDYKDGSKRWYLGKRLQLTEVAKELRPYLIVKHDIATRFIEALSYFPDSKMGVNIGAGEAVWAKEDIMKVATIALTLNPGTELKKNKNKMALEAIGKLYASVDALIGEQ